MKALAREDDTRGLRLTPLVDMVFNLLVFFLVAGSLREAERDLPIRLAGVSPGEARPAGPETLTVQVQADGAAWADGQARAPGELETFLRERLSREPQTAVILRCDRDTRHADFVRVLDACERAGARQVDIAGRMREEPAPQADP